MLQANLLQRAVLFHTEKSERTGGTCCLNNEYITTPGLIKGACGILRCFGFEHLLKNMYSIVSSKPTHP